MSTTGTPPTASKPWYSSMTIQGIIVGLIGAFTPQIAALLHVQAGDVTAIVSDLVTVIGAVIAAIGRSHATQPLR